MPNLKSVALILLIGLCVACPVHAAERDITLQWDKSIDDPYLQSYNVYYYTTSGNSDSLDPADYAASYTLLGGNPITIPNPGPKPITIDKSNTQITLHFSDNSKDYYFVVTSIDTRGLEGVATSEISLLKLKVQKTSVKGGGTGTVTSTPSGILSDINCSESLCSADYPGGSKVTLTATPDSNNAFTGWSGGGCSSTGTCIVTVIPAITVTATFEPIRKLEVFKAATGGTGTVTSSPTGVVGLAINCGTSSSSASADYIIETSVTLTAQSASDSTFLGWSGDCVGTGLSCQVTMAAAKSVTATFTPIRKLEVLKAATGGTGTVTSSPTGVVGSAINCGTSSSSASADYIIGTAVTLTAQPATGNTFSGWSGDCVGTGLSCQVTMAAAKSVTATFRPLRTLTVQKTGNGTGTVTSLASSLGIPSHINCGTTCPAPVAADYIIDTVVTLTAAPALGNTFTGWSGDCVGTGLSCQVTMAAAKSVTATFMSTYKLTVQKAGAGSGTVTSSASSSGIPSHIDCGPACTTPVSADYIIGTAVTLTVTPAAGSNFQGWSGGGCSGVSSCIVNMDVAKTATAAFLLKGDINLDGIVNLADAILILKIASRVIPSGTIEKDSDVNADGKLGMADMIYVLQKIANLRQ